MIKRRSAISALLVFVLTLASCTQSQILSTLTAVVNAAEIAIPIIGSAVGLNPATSSLIVHYLEAISTASGKASTILAGSGTAAEKTALIIAAFAQVTAINLPPGTPAQIVAAINAVAQAVINFLSNFPPPNVKSVANGKSMTMSASDQLKLTNLKVRSDANLAKLKGIKR